MAGTTTERGETAFERNARYALILLFVIYTANFIDRQILSILMEPIRKELHLSDSELGFLSGLAFALFYATLGIPIARLADRISRRNIVAVSLALWSLMTALSGFAQNFVQLLFARVGVGVGEAGCSPAAHSMISDYFPAERRGMAMSIYSVGTPIGILLGLAGGGWVNLVFGWRAAFFVVGLPGLVIALLFYLTVREPRRGAQDAAAPDAPHPTVGETFRYLWRLKTLRYLSLAVACHALNAYGIQQWNPSFLIRTFGMDTRVVGLELGLIIGIAGTAGVLTGGFLTDWLGKHDFRWYIWVQAISIAVAIPFYFLTFTAQSAAQALTLYIGPAFLVTLFQGPAFATVQSLAPAPMRALAASIFLFIINIVGLGLGPFTIGVLSDVLRHSYGVAGLRYAILIVLFIEFGTVFFFWRASKFVLAETAAAKRYGETP